MGLYHRMSIVDGYGLCIPLSTRMVPDRLSLPLFSELGEIAHEVIHEDSFTDSPP